MDQAGERLVDKAPKFHWFRFTGRETGGPDSSPGSFGPSRQGLRSEIVILIAAVGAMSRAYSSVNPYRATRVAPGGTCSKN